MTDPPTPGVEPAILEAEKEPVRPMPSSNDSAANDHLEQHKLLLQNFDLLFKKVEQMADHLSASADALESTRKEMVVTMELAQQMISRQDEQVEHMGQATLALLNYLDAHEARSSRT